MAAARNVLLIVVDQWRLGLPTGPWPAIALRPSGWRCARRGLRA